MPASWSASRPRTIPGGPLAGIAFQRHWEERAFEAGGRTTTRRRSASAISSRGKPSTALGDVVPSYQPGVTPADLADCLPDYAVAAIREALPGFDRQIKGFALADAVMTGVETRTSSPIRIPRDATLQSLNTRGLYPAGEGAGYAGGILSAGVDGIRIAEAVALSIAGSRDCGAEIATHRSAQICSILLFIAGPIALAHRQVLSRSLIELPQASGTIPAVRR